MSPRQVLSPGQVESPDTVASLLREGARRIPRAESRLLLAHALKRPVEWLIAHDDDAIDEASAARHRSLVARRARGEPVAYLCGSREFLGRDFAVSPAVLIPRPETELLVEAARVEAARVSGSHARHRALDVVDLGTGSGIIAISLALALPHARIVAVDRSAQALAVAAANAMTHGVHRQIEFRLGDWWRDWEPAASSGALLFDLVVSNPPYVAAEDHHMQTADLRFEPRIALTPGTAGDESLVAICAGLGRHCAPGAAVLFEHGHDQGARCRELLVAAGIEEVRTLQDHAGLDRVSMGTASAWT